VNPELPFDVDMLLKPEIINFYDEATNAFSYIVKDPTTHACAVVDSVMDIDYPAGRTSFESADKIVRFIESKGWQNEWVLETHVHADHLTAAAHIQQKLGGKLGISDQISVVQKVFGDIFEEGDEFRRDGSQFDQLLAEGGSYSIGSMALHAWNTPGHTPACMSYIIGDAVFVGDTLFMPDGGTARADFPGGDARTLYQSIQRLFSLPEDMRVLMCHDYPENRTAQWLTSIKKQREENIHINVSIDEDSFVAMREKRDKTLGAPRLLFPSLQVNMRAGRLPPAGESGKAFFKIPLNVL
jgi:glyoxylase-like metal-dependent hydrolase (beta-lactamase superfamily II)